MRCCPGAPSTRRASFYVNAASTGFIIELPPFAGIDGETLGALAGTLADAAPERCTIQVIHWTSPRFGAASRAWAEPRRDAGGALARMGAKRRELLAPGGWRRLHRGGPPFTLSDYRVFVTACLAGGPGPASGDGARRVPPGARRHARLGGRQHAQAGAGRAAVAGGGTRRARHCRISRRGDRTPGPALVAARSAARAVHRPGTRADRGADRPHLPRPGDGEDIAVRVLSAIAFPEVWPGWRGNALIGDFHRDFLQPGAPVLTCLTVVTGDEAAGEKAFLKSARATQQAGTGLARYLPGLPEKARDWQAVTERIKDGERLVRACYMAAVYAPLDALDEAEQAVRAIYHGQGWRVNAERYMQLPSWLACLPMVPAGGLDADLERMGRMKTLLTSSAVNLAPLHGEWRGQPANPDNPPALFLIGRRGQPACWSPFANEAGNYNVAVTGKSGSGKSVLMQELVTGLIGAGGEAVVIDDGRSFQHTAEALGGAFIAFGKDPACLNPFAMIDAETANHDGDYREECFAMLAGVIGRMARRRGGIDDIEAALIAEAISAAWDEAGNEADLGTVRKNLEARSDRRAADMATSLGPWCPGGAMGRLFAGSNVPDLENAMTVFELAELKGRGDVQGVVLMLVVFLATQRMYHGPRTRTKAIVIDEAWDLLSGEDSRTFLEGAARRARKYRGALVTGTQSVNDYYANPAARAAWENSDWVIFLAQKDESVELLKSEKRIHCDPGMERALKSLTTADGRYAELVLHGPDGWRVARLVLDAWSVALFSSRGPAFAAVETLKAEGLTTVEAIDRIAGAAGPGGRRSFCRCRPVRNHRNGRYRMTAKTAGARRRTGNGETERPLNWPGDPETVAPEDIDFEALAHVLANTCRRGGCCRHYHSVAAHAVIVSEEIEALDGLGEQDRRTLALHALLSDAPSAWLRGAPAGFAAGRGSCRAARHGDWRGGARGRRAGCGAGRGAFRTAALGHPHDGRGRTPGHHGRCARRRRRRLSAAEAAHPLGPAGQSGAGLARPVPGARRDGRGAAEAHRGGPRITSGAGCRTGRPGCRRRLTWTGMDRAGR